jgi:hypothetical protein
VLLRRVDLQGQHGRGLILALQAGRPVVARQTDGGPVVTAHFDGEAVDSLIIYTRSGGPAFVCYWDPIVAAEGEWSANLLPRGGDDEFGYGLPLTHPDYNLHHRSEDSSDPPRGDFEEAKRRIESIGAPLDSADFADLRAPLSPRWSTTEYRGGCSTARWSRRLRKLRPSMSGRSTSRCSSLSTPRWPGSPGSTSSIRT